MRKTNIFQVMKAGSRTMMSILMHWPRHKKAKQKLWHPWPQQTEHHVKLETNNIRYECDVVIFLNNSCGEIVTMSVKTTPQKTRFRDVKFARIWDTD